MNGLFYIQSPIDYWLWENEFWRCHWHQTSHAYFMRHDYILDNLWVIQEQFLQQYDYD
jgi:hypothetical protein